MQSVRSRLAIGFLRMCQNSEAMLGFANTGRAPAEVSILSKPHAIDQKREYAKIKWNGVPYVRVRQNDAEWQPTPSSAKNLKQKKRMEQKRQFRELEAAKRKAQVKAKEEKRDIERKARWKRASERVKEWNEFLAKVSAEEKQKTLVA